MIENWRGHCWFPLGWQLSNNSVALTRIITTATKNQVTKAFQVQDNNNQQCTCFRGLYNFASCQISFKTEN